MLERYTQGEVDTHWKESNSQIYIPSAPYYLAVLAHDSAYSSRIISIGRFLIARVLIHVFVSIGTNIVDA